MRSSFIVVAVAFLALAAAWTCPSSTRARPARRSDAAAPWTPPLAPAPEPRPASATSLPSVQPPPPAVLRDSTPPVDERSAASRRALVDAADASAKLRAVRALSAYDDDATEALLREVVLLGASPRLRSAAVFALSSRRPGEFAFLRDVYRRCDDDRVRGAILLKASEWNGLPEVSAFLSEEALRAPDARLRGTAALADAAR